MRNRFAIIAAVCLPLLVFGFARDYFWPPAMAINIPAGGCTLQLIVDQTTSTDLYTATNNVYICAVLLVSATAQNVSIAQGTGTVCATSPQALIGGSGVTSSIALAANGGFVLSMPSGSFIKTTATAKHLCVLQSSTGNVSGVISYMDSP